MTEIILAAPIDKGSRGRNSWFTARSLIVRTALAGEHPQGGPMPYPSHVEMCAASVRAGRREPLVLRLSLADATILAETILWEVGGLFRPPIKLVPADVVEEPPRCPNCGAQDGKVISHGNDDAQCAYCGEYWSGEEEVSSAPTV